MRTRSVLCCPRGRISVQCSSPPRHVGARHKSKDTCSAPLDTRFSIRVYKLSLFEGNRHTKKRRAAQKVGTLENSTLVSQLSFSAHVQLRRVGDVTSKVPAIPSQARSLMANALLATAYRRRTDYYGRHIGRPASYLRIDGPSVHGNSVEVRIESLGERSIHANSSEYRPSHRKPRLRSCPA